MRFSSRRWSPGHLDPIVTLNTHIVLYAAMLIRGVDYASGETDFSARRLGAIELAAPLWLWGGLFMTAAMVGFLGMAARSVDAVITAHSMGAALYTTLAAGIGWDAWRLKEQANFPLSWVLLLMVALVTVVWLIDHARDEVSLYIGAGVFVAAGLAIASVPLDSLRNATVLLSMAVFHALMAAGNAMRWVREEEIQRRLSDE